MGRTWWFPLVLVLGCAGEIRDAGPESGGKADAARWDAPLRRLTEREYRNTVQEIFGPVDLSAFDGAFPVEGSVGGFDNHVDVQSVTTAHVQTYQRLAESVASQVLTSDAQAIALVGCNPNADAGCLDSFVRRIARRVYRRTPTDAEVTLLLSVGDSLKELSDPWAPVSGILQTFLQQPQFLFRVELGIADSEGGGLRKLTGYEVASRLAFALWEMGPTSELLDRAEVGELDTREGVERAAREMLEDARADRTVQTFAHQWLTVNALDGRSFDSDRFPAYDDALRDSAKRELLQLIDEVLLADRSALELYTSREIYVDDVLASFYGLPPVHSSEPVGISAPEESHRGGLFGTAAFLMLTSKANRTSVVHRGLFVRNILCDAPPPPPPGVETDLPPDEGFQALDAHLSDSACAACHVNIDPIGYGLEHYDAIGSYRTSYSNGEPIPEGWIEGMAGSAFRGAPALGELVASSPQSGRCMAEKYYRWLFGRNLDSSESVLIDGIEQAFRDSDYRFRELIVAAVTSDAFRFLQPDEEE